jgi:pSer/pThr/pTyr-binding forkhead associated (FHA) protein
MSDPRLGGAHLNTTRCYRYDAAVDELLDARGPATGDADPLIRRPAARVQPRHQQPVPAGGTYTLVSLADGTRHRLRVGVNALGRFRENDLVFIPIHVSRRHCLVVVHATGGCEVSDTASRNGTFVNRRRVERAELFPGDILAVCDQRFLVVWIGPDGQVLPASDPPDTWLLGGLSPTSSDA